MCRAAPRGQRRCPTCASHRPVHMPFDGVKLDVSWKRLTMAMKRDNASWESAVSQACLGEQVVQGHHEAEANHCPEGRFLFMAPPMALRNDLVSDDIEHSAGRKG